MAKKTPDPLWQRAPLRQRRPEARPELSYRRALPATRFCESGASLFFRVDLLFLLLLLVCPGGGTEDPGVITQFGGHDFEGIHKRGEHTSFGR